MGCFYIIPCEMAMNINLPRDFPAPLEKPQNRPYH